MAKWYKRYGADFIAATMKLTLEEKGAYSLCLDLMYERGGPIPDDARWLSGVCNVSMRKWNSLRESLIQHGKLTVEGDTLTNSRAAFELVSAEFQRRNQAETGAKGGRQRVENEAKRNKINDNAQGTLKPIEESRGDKTLIGKPISGATRGSRLPAEFVMPVEWKQWAADELGWGFGDIREERLRFIDFWHAKAGKDGTKLDWQATWRNWCRNSRRTGNRANAGTENDNRPAL